MEFLSRFPFVIKYTPGKTHVADPVSRNPLLYEEETPTEVISVAAGLLGAVVAVCAGMVTRGRALREARNQEGEDPEIELSLPQASTPNLEPGGGERKSATQSLGTPCDREWTAGAYHDEGGSLPLQIKQAYHKDARFAVQEFTHKLKMRDGIWMLGNKIVVPQDKALRAQIVQACHDDAMSGHVGITKTLHLVSRHFQWENMRTDVEDYVRHCDACQVNKASTKAYAGKLQPLSIPGRRWEHITMDLIVKLPKTDRGHDSILVFVDRLSKMVHIIPTVESLDALKFARRLDSEVARYARLSAVRGPQFNNLFWKEVNALTGMKRKLSSAYHPQTDGQTERTT